MPNGSARQSDESTQWGWKGTGGNSGCRLFLKPTWPDHMLGMRICLLFLARKQLRKQQRVVRDRWRASTLALCERRTGSMAELKPAGFQGVLDWNGLAGVPRSKTPAP